MTKILFLFCGDATNRGTIVRKLLSAVKTPLICPTRWVIVRLRLRCRQPHRVSRAISSVFAAVGYQRFVYRSNRAFLGRRHCSFYKLVG